MKEWKGYTLEELRMKRLVVSTCLEIKKAVVLDEINEMSQRGLGGNSIWKRMLGALNYADYAVFAFKAGRNLFRAFRK